MVSVKSVSKHPASRVSNSRRDSGSSILPRNLCDRIFTTPALRPMKNIQIIDGALNCVYDIFAATDDEFALIFPAGQNIGFIDEVLARGNAPALDDALNNIWRRRIPKINVNGIHGVLFYQNEHKKAYYPTRRDEEAVNPDGTPLR